MAITIVKIDSFDPLKYSVSGDAPYIGSIKVLLPESHFNVLGLKLMDAVMPELGVHLGSNARYISWDLEGITAPGICSDELDELMQAAAPHFSKLWRSVQDELDRRGPLLGSA